MQQPVLRVVRVLVLVDEDVAKSLLPLLQGFREALEHVDGQHQQVVEVDRVRGEQAPLVQLVHVRDGLVVEGLDLVRVLVRSDQPVLRVRDLVVDPSRREALRVPLELFEALLHEPDLVGLVVDREVGAVAEPLRFSAQDAAARGVEGEDPEAAAAPAEQAFEPFPHLPRRLVGERDREDLVGLCPDRVDQVRDAVGQHARLARACSRDDQERPFRGENCLALGGVQVGEVLLG